jgi:hypothetical protein
MYTDICVLYAALKVMSFSLLTYSVLMKLPVMFCRPIILCLFNCITETLGVTESRRYFP